MTKLNIRTVSVGGVFTDGNKFFKNDNIIPLDYLMAKAFRKAAKKDPLTFQIGANKVIIKIAKQSAICKTTHTINVSYASRKVKGDIVSVDY